MSDIYSLEGRPLATYETLTSELLWLAQVGYQSFEDIHVGV